MTKRKIIFTDGNLHTEHHVSAPAAFHGHLVFGTALGARARLATVLEVGLVMIGLVWIGDLADDDFTDTYSSTQRFRGSASAGCRCEVRRLCST